MSPTDVRVDDRFVIRFTDTLLLSGNKHIFNLKWSLSHVPWITKCTWCRRQKICLGKKCCSCRLPPCPTPRVRSQAKVSVLQKVNFSSAGQIFQLVKSHSSGGNALINKNNKSSFCLFPIYYNCFYWFFFFCSTLNIADNGRTQLPSASWQLRGWILMTCKTEWRVLMTWCHHSLIQGLWS